MKPILVCLAVAAVAFAAALADEPAAVKHRFLAVDNGGNQLLCVDQIDPARSWAVAIPAGSRDIQILDGNGCPMPASAPAAGAAAKRILVSHGNGAAEYDLATGKKLAWAVDRYKGIQSSLRMADGNTLLAGVDGTVYTVDSSGKELSRVQPKEKMDVRLLRLTDAGNVLYSTAHSEHAVVEMTRSGEIVRKIPIPGKGYKAEQLPGGHFLTSTGDECKLIEIDADGKVISFVGGKKEHPTLGLDFCSGWDVLSGGNKVMANWLGHGKQGKGVHLAEFTPDNKLVWQWADHKLAKQITNVKMLE